MFSITKFVYNNFTHNVANVFFYIIYNYYSNINYKIENDFIEKKILSITKRIKRFHEIRKILKQRYFFVIVVQTKYYNKKHIFINFVVEKLMLLNIKNFK